MLSIKSKFDIIRKSMKFLEITVKEAFPSHLLHFLLSEKVLTDFLSRSVERMNPNRLRRFSAGSPGTWGGLVHLNILDHTLFQ